MVLSRRYGMVLGALLVGVSGCKKESSHDHAVHEHPSSLKPAAPVAATTPVAIQVNIHTTSTEPGVSAGAERVATHEPREARLVGDPQRAAYPEPPARESGEPQRLIHYFCRCWKDEAYDRMYGALHSDFRKATSFADFKRRIQADAAANGGLDDERLLQAADNAGSQITWVVQLVFQNRRAAPRTVKATVKKTPKGYRLLDPGLVPIDLDDL